MGTKPLCPSCGKPMEANAPKGLCPECLMKGAFPTGTDTGGKPPRFVPPPIEELSAKFPHLEILELIGQGGMGAVYKASQKQLDRVVALKILPPQTAGGPRFAERFSREARALAKLNHPHIVTLYEFGQANGLFYFLMEFVDGINLRQLLDAGRVAPSEALAIVPQICEALQYAHERGIVHRDIKPENILLNKDGQVKIADFGVAKIVAQSPDETNEQSPADSTELTEAGSVLGTPQYMAPEQIKNSADVDHRADIYSLGVVFYQMLTGEMPSATLEPPSRKVQIDVRLDEVVLRALERKPELRYQQAGVLKTEVETIATTMTTEPASAAREDATPAGIVSRKSPAVRAIEALLESRFSSPLATRLINASMLGFLASLGALGFLPLPGMRFCFGFFGFAGFFGLIGLAILVEFMARGKGGGSSAITTRFLRTAIVAVCGAAVALASLILASIVHEKTQAAAPEIARMMEHGSPTEITNSTVIQSWSNLIHLRRYLLVPLGIGGISAAVIFGWLAACQLRRPKKDPVLEEAWSRKASRQAFFFAGLSAILAVAALCLQPNPSRALMWSMPVAALLGIAFGIPAHKRRLGKSSIAIGCLSAALWVAVLAAAHFSPIQPRPDEVAHFGQRPGDVIAQTLQHEVGRQLREAGATYEDLQVTVAIPRDSATPFKVSYRGLQNFRGPDGTTPAADGEFVMEYIGDGQWQGVLAGKQITVQVGSRDAIDLPFVNDPQVIGEWKSVDFVANISDFNPDKPNWPEDRLFLTDLTFQENGSTSKPWWTWTKGVLIHHGDKTASRYEIREINGRSYLFLEWKSGDVTISGKKPQYYVMAKSTDKVAQ